MKEMIKLMDNSCNANWVVKGVCRNIFLQVIKVIDLHVIGSLHKEAGGSPSGGEQWSTEHVAALTG